MYMYQGVYDGVRHVLMEIATPIPSTLRVAQHWCYVFYIGHGTSEACFALATGCLGIALPPSMALTLFFITFNTIRHN